MTDLVLEDINIIEELNEGDFNQETIDEFNKIKNDIKESKNNIINLKKNDDKVKNELELMIEKNLLINHIEGKFSKLEQKMRLIEL